MRKMEKGELPWFQYLSSLFDKGEGKVIGYDPLLISAGLIRKSIRNNLKF